jgi:monothiol glutaredoxin
MDDALKAKIEGILAEKPIVVFMKGTKNFPQCGFSATVVEVMKRMDADFKDVNILAEADLRAGMKEYGNWPTFPQVYIKGKLVGGCDIVRDMYTSGELEPLVKDATGPSSK